MSYRFCTLVERSVTPPSLWTGKKLFQTLVGVAPDAASRIDAHRDDEGNDQAGDEGAGPGP